MSDDTDFRKSRERLEEELRSLHDSWHQYQFLFVQSAERVRMLNALAAGFFGSLQRLLTRDVIRGISKLTDPLKARGKSYLVLQALLSDPSVSEHPGLAEELERRVQTIDGDAEKIRAHRNRYITHLDHATFLGDSEILPGVTDRDISHLIGGMEDVYTLHARRIYGVETSFDVGTSKSVEALVGVLESSDGWRRRKELKTPTNP
jgi:hypothetical protein